MKREEQENKTIYEKRKIGKINHNKKGRTGKQNPI